MKKGRVFGKRQITLAVMVLALAAAVWFNMKYSISTGDKDAASKYLGEAEYVSNDDTQSAIETAAKAEQDYFSTVRQERAKTRNEAVELLEDTINDATLSDAVKTEAVSRKAEITTQMENEAAVESLLKAKGFNNAVVIIGDSDVNIVVKGDELTKAETIQIQDAAQSQTGFSLENIKIVTVK